MRTRPLPGCWYTDALPSGPYVSAQFGLARVETDRGLVDGRVLQWVRLAPTGRRFMGTDADRPIAWEWTDSGWQDRGAFVAPRAVIYEANGTPYIERVGGWDDAHPETSPGAQGWRYIDDAGRRVPAWTTYDSLKPVLYQHTTRRDVLIGQGQTGVLALVAGKQVRLDRLFPDVRGGEYLAVNFNRSGDDYAVSWYVAHSPTSYTACIVWLTDAELRALPDATAPVPLPPVDPLPSDPEPVMMKLPADVKAIRARYVAKFPVPQGVAGAAFEETVRQWSIGFAEQVRHDTNDPTFGVKRADPNRPIGKDTLARVVGVKLYSWDLLGGAGTGSPTLNLDPDAEDVTGQVFVPVLPVDHLSGVPVPVPVPQPPPPSAPAHPSFDDGYKVALEIADAYTAGTLGHGQSMRDAIGTLYHLLFGLLLEGRSPAAVIDEARKRGNDEWKD